jgi:hypothetical protein
MHVNAAHIADLVRDDIEGGQQSLDRAAAILSDEQFEMPQVLLWISEVRQLLYEGKSLAAREKLLKPWSQLENSSVNRIAYYHWLTRYLRINADLACAVADPAHKKQYLKDAQQQLQQLAKLDLPAFRTYANALRLVVNAATGKVEAIDRWQVELDAARDQQLNLLAVALQWHIELAFPTPAPSAARQRLLEHGAVSPERLMNIILPLRMK